MPPARTPALVALLALLPLAQGCKWLGGDKGSPSAPAGEKFDPLMGTNRITPQSGVLGRDPLTKAESDPLTARPASRDRRSTNDDLPPRGPADRSRRVPYRPNPADSPAGLTSGRDFDSGLEINRAEPDSADALDSFEEVAGRLRAAGATVARPTPAGAGWSVTATMPIGGEPPGSRRFAGTGPTPAAAAADALDQVRAKR